METLTALTSMNSIIEELGNTWFATELKIKNPILHFTATNTVRILLPSFSI